MGNRIHDSDVRHDRRKSRSTVIEGLVKAGLQALPANLRYSVVSRLAARSFRFPLSNTEVATLRSARRVQFGTERRTSLWTWGEGPVVVLVHGWGGCAAQMGSMAARLAQNGFRAVAFDVSGHGTSTVREIRWDWFMDDIAAVTEAVGPVAGLIGHSAGGLAMMAARRLYGVHARRFVCIGAPHHPYPPIHEIKRRLDPGEVVLERYRLDISTQFGTDWPSLVAGSAWMDAGEDLLLCYDLQDRYVHVTDGDRIAALCPGSRVLRTDGLGHRRILTSIPLADAVASFLAE